MTYRFGPYELNAQTGELRKSGVRVRLGGQPIEVLTLLVGRAGKLVTRDELKEALWKEETFTDFDHGVNTAVQRIRRALEDSATEPRFIETLPRKGYRFVAEVERLDLESSADPAPWRRVVLQVVLAVAALVAVVALTSDARTDRSSMRFTERALTSTPGEEDYPRFSPDGANVVYSWDGGSNGPHDIYITPIEAGVGPPTQVTSDPRDEIQPAWSPNGSKIVFARLLDDNPAPMTPWRFELVLATPVAGGSQQVLTEFETRSRQVYPSWAPNGRSIAFSCRIDAPPGLRQVCIYSLDSGRIRALTSPTGDVGDGQAIFRPDARAIAYASSGRLHWLKLSESMQPEGSPQALVPDSAYPYPAGWSLDGGQLYFLGLRLRAGYGVWAVAPESQGSQSLRLSLPPPHAGERPYPSIWWSPSGALRMAYQKRDKEAEIVRIDLSEREFGRTSLVSRANRPDFNPEYSPDGSQIAFISSRSGVDALWICSRDGSDPELVTELGRFAGFSHPRWSPDGRRIVLDAIFKTQSRDVYIVDVAAKRISSPLTSGGGRSPTWSRDGRSLYYGHGRESGIWRLDLETGEESEVLAGAGRGPAIEAPDSSGLYFRNADGHLWWLRLNKRRKRAGKALSLTETQPRSHTVGPTAVYWINNEGDLFALDHGSDHVRLLMRIESHRPDPNFQVSHGISISPDEAELLYTDWLRDEADLYLLESVP